MTAPVADPSGREQPTTGLTLATRRQLLATSEALLAQAVATLDDQAMRAPSDLPRWSRGHVISHLARNADGLANLVRGALIGEARPMYSNPESRDSDIEAGAGRSAADLRADLQTSTGTLAELLTQLGELPARWDFTIRLRNGRELPARKVAGLRRVEVEVHRVDLLLTGHGPASWPDDFVAATLRAETTASAESQISALVAPDGRRWLVGPPARPELIGPAHALLCWALGRSCSDTLTTSDGSPVPPAPTWR